MGCRALLACERAGSYDLYRSHEEGLALAALLPPVKCPDPTSVPGVDVDRIATTVSAQAVAEELDPVLDEALYVIDASGTVTSYCVVALIVDPTVSDRAVPGLLARAHETAIRPLFHQIQGARTALLILGSDSALSDQVLVETLERTVDDWAVSTHRIADLDDGTLL